uniref:2OG-Fe(II) oxygenase superfamily protein n=1 Tax=Pithovirus LCPAC201 TaxID=2506591 RepID=A0A481Z653_9VIRU|nr:MAG: uncharacterized protein LCPAC201_03260 [Pithovirus LCPAC201]
MNHTLKLVLQPVATPQLVVQLIIPPSVTPCQHTITLTFGDQAENHVGMQKIGQLATNGFNLEDLTKIKELMEKYDVRCELIHLNPYLPSIFQGESSKPAYILIIREGVDHILNTQNAMDLLAEQARLQPDTKAFMYGRVVNKKARHNLCFSEIGQEPDYENKKGRIVPYSEVPLLNFLRLSFPTWFGLKAQNLVIEGNYYYDVTKCGIGFHGDSERRRVIGVRLGAPLPLNYQWFLESKPVGTRIKLIINHGDIYIMSEKAVGTDWKKKKTLTLRHAAGCDKYLKINGSLG